MLITNDFVNRIGFYFFLYYLSKMKYTKEQLKELNEENVSLVIKKDFEKLLSKNKWFIYKIANALHNPEYLDDLIQMGNIGLYNAMQDFCPEKGVYFITYAKIHVRGEMLTWLMQNKRTIRIPQNILSDYFKKNKEYCAPNPESETEEEELPICTSGQEIIDDITQAEEEDTSRDFDVLYRAINKLIKKEDWKIILYYRFGLFGFEKLKSTNEISKKIGISDSLCKWRLKTMLELLKKNSKLAKQFK